jgi:hypothetical protein
MILTIAIPTYNRNAILRENLARLLPQLTPECCLLILDNHSPQPVADTLADLLAQYPQVNCQIRRHRMNLGGDANVVRCIELCETPWLWILGDDDAPRPDAVATIFATIRRWPDAVFFNFACELFPRKTTIVGESLETFLDQLDCFRNVQFMSTDVFRSDTLQSAIAYAYEFTYGRAAHVAALFLALGSDRQFCLLDSAIVHWAWPPGAIAWSHLRYALALPINADLPIPPRSRQRLARMLAKEIHFFAVATVLLHFIQQGTVDRQTAVYLMDQICSRTNSCHPELGRRVQSWIVRTLVRFPRVSLRAVRLAFRIIYRQKLADYPPFHHLLAREVNEEGMFRPDLLPKG